MTDKPKSKTAMVLPLLLCPRLTPEQFQPDGDSPGLYIRCATTDQRAAIIAVLTGKTL